MRLLLFDVDGVLLKEHGYYRTAAFTCAVFYERFCMKHGVVPNENKLANGLSFASLDALIEVYFPSELLSFLRFKAINSNWDKTYCIVLAMSYLFNHGDMKDDFTFDILELFRLIPGMGGQFITHLKAKTVSSDQGNLFEQVYQTFQQVHLGPWGEDPFLERGMLEYDELTVSPTTLTQLFLSLQQVGFELGIGTGRPYLEVRRPFEKYDIWHWFKKEYIVTIDEVLQEEKNQELEAFTLAKPHPFTYQKGSNSYPHEDVYVVGDSVSDLLAAHSAEYHFIGIGSPDSFAGHLHTGDVVVETVLDLLQVFINIE